MSLFDLLSSPKSPEDWEQYSFSTRNQVDLIRSAILKQYNINLTQYQLYPLDLSNEENRQYWLQQNSQSHDDFNAVLGQQSSDIDDVDFKNEKELEAWIFLVYQELFTACSILKI